MTIQTFIERAIEGGWRFPEEITTDTQWLLSGDDRATKALMLLDPLAWKAVGKVEGWAKEPLYACSSCHMDAEPEPSWQIKMHRMIDALAEGKTIEQYLETL